MGNAEVPPVPPGARARTVMAEMSRSGISHLDRRDYSHLSDTEALDPAQYSIFPNIVIFRSLGYPFLYRFLPVRNDPHSTVFEFMFFRPKPTDNTPIPEVKRVELGEHDSYADCGALPPWQGLIYDQDSTGLAMLQEGLRAGAPDDLNLSRYQEVRIRHMHQTLMRYISTDSPGSCSPWAGGAFAQTYPVIHRVRLFQSPWLSVPRHRDPWHQPPLQSRAARTPR
jgi:Ring hydroxylating alpha subunit (catalytic domain)